MAIYLIGDGILDNFKYLDDKDLDLNKELMNLGLDVHNFAKEEMKVIDVLNGLKLTSIQIKSRNYNYQVDNTDNKLYPLKLLENTSNKKILSFNNIYGNTNLNTNMAVISIGGNDVGERFFNIVLGVDYFINAIITEEFTNNYGKIIESININCKKMLLISMYLPYLGEGSSYVKYNNYAIPIMKKWNNFIYLLAQKYNIPVLDLNKTLNNKDRTHYSASDDTRLSNISSKCLSRCIKYIYNNYEGHSIYYSPNCDCKKIKRMKKS